MSDVFEEVEEGLRSDQANVLWKKYGWILYLVGGLIVAAVAAYEFSKSQTKNAQVRQIEQFELARTALDAGNYADAETRFAEIVSGGSDLAPLASHYLAKTRLEGGGDRVRAAEALAKNAASDDPFAKIAALKSAYLAVDGLTLVELEDRLAGPLQEEGVIGALALELVAAKAYQEGDFERARADFALLQIFPGAPSGVLARAEAALSVIPSKNADSIEPETEPVNSEEEAGQ